MGYLSNETQGTGIIFGFLKQIRKFARLYNTNKLVFAWDSKSSKRRELFPGYRLHDSVELTEEEKKWHSDSFKQFTLIKKEVLPICGFYNSFKQKGYEADDIIASIVNNTDGKKIILSADEDMYQLLNEDTFMYDIKKKCEYTKADFMTEFGIHPDKWVEVKAIAGCKSDKVPGCKGVGEKTVLKFLKKELKKNSIKYKTITDYVASEDYLLYNKMVSLPFEGTKIFDVDLACTFNNNGFKNICNRFKFNSFLMPHSLNEWQEIFR